MATSLHLHEELMLLSLKDEEGTVLSGAMYGWAIGAAVMADLLMSGRVGLEGEGKKATVTVRDETPTHDPLLDEWLSAIGAAAKPKTLQQWVTSVAGTRSLKDRVARQLVRRGIRVRSARS